jgi:hypothetical protein
MAHRRVTPDCGSVVPPRPERPPGARDRPAEGILADRLPPILTKGYSDSCGHGIYSGIDSDTPGVAVGRRTHATTCNLDARCSASIPLCALVKEELHKRVCVFE